jgi:hypothetical protein
MHKKYNLLINNEIGETADNCLSIKIIRDKNDSKISVIIGHVSALLDLEAVRDLINIIYPMFIYRQLVETINVQRQKLVP